MLGQFPFPIRGFHSDNGSSSSTHGGRPAEQAVDRTDQIAAAASPTTTALVEAKNGAVIRKHMGYGYIAAAHAEAIDRILPASLQPVLELPSAVRAAGADRGPARQRDIRISALCNAVGSAARTGVRRAGRHPRACKPAFGIQNVGPDREPAQRHRVGQADARGQAKAVPGLPSGSQKRMKTAGRSAVEMPGCGKAGKPKPGFPSFPPPLEIATRFPHSHRAGDGSLFLFETNRNHTKGAQNLRRPASALQAHSLIRKCLSFSFRAKSVPAQKGTRIKLVGLRSSDLML